MKGLIKVIGKFVKSNSSTILIVSGIAGMVVACGTTAKAYEQTKKEIEKLKEELNGEKPTTMQVIKRSAKHWVWPFLAFSTSTACICGAYSIVLKEKAAWISAYKVAEASLMEFKDSAAEIVGPDAVKAIETHHAEEKADIILEEMERGNLLSSTIPTTGDGTELIYDDYTGDLFYSDRNKLSQAFNVINNRMNSERYMLLRELTDEQNRPCGVVADTVGWNVDSQGLISWDFYPVEKFGKLCWSLVYTQPVSDFKDRY